MNITKWGILGVGAILFAFATIVSLSSLMRGSEEVEIAPRVLKVGNQFDANVADIVAPFDDLVKRANARIEALLSQANTFQSASSIIGWIAVFFSATITILAAFAGVNPAQLPTDGQKRNRIVIVIAVLAAISSSLLLVNERLEKSSRDARQAANKLYDKASVARRSFLDAGGNRATADAAKDDLFHAMAEAGDEG